MRPDVDRLDLVFALKLIHVSIRSFVNTSFGEVFVVGPRRS